MVMIERFSDYFGIEENKRAIAVDVATLASRVQSQANKIDCTGEGDSELGKKYIPIYRSNREKDIPYYQDGDHPSKQRVDLKLINSQLIRQDKTIKSCYR